MRSLTRRCAIGAVLAFALFGLRLSGQTPALLTGSSLHCRGVFLSPGVESGIFSTSYPVAMRRVGGVRHYFIYDGKGSVYEFTEPTLSPCSTALVAAAQATITQNWGKFPVAAGEDKVPGHHGSEVAFGLTFDPVLQQLILSWADTYSNSAVHNGFAAATLNEATHTLSVRGCWGVTGRLQSWIGTGAFRIPASFVSANLPAGAAWAIGLGGIIANAGQYSQGLTLFAVVPPPDNPCQPSLDTFVPGTALAYYEPNYTGPTCGTLGSSGAGLGCGTWAIKPPQYVAPTPPYPARMSFCAYSDATYLSSWDPYQGQCWFSANQTWRATWYDDGTQAGVVLATTKTSGWMNTTVSASPVAAISFPNGSTTLPLLDMHDGATINPDDILWMQTCNPSSDAGCETVNNNHLSIVKVTAVDAAAKRVSFTILDVDHCTTCTHTPIVGGSVFGGAVYAHGIASLMSRDTLRGQIYDPAQYAEVVRGTRQPYDVRYSEEFDLTALLPGFGGPTTGHGISGQLPGGGNLPSITSVIADPEAHQLIFVFRHGKPPDGLVYDALYVVDVGTPVTPTPTPTPPAPTPTPTPPTPPQPTPGESAEGTTVPPSLQIIDSQGATWAITNGVTVTRNGVWAQPALATQLLYVARVVYVFGLDGNWWHLSGTWMNDGPTKPTSGPTPTPTPAPVPAPTPTPTPPPPPVDPCVATPLRVTNIRWPSGQTGTRTGTWNSGTFALVKADFEWNPLRLIAIDTRGCTVTVIR